MERAKKTQLIFATIGSLIKVEGGELVKLHPIELDRRFRLPDPTKTIESIWKALKRSKQRLDTSIGSTGASSSSPNLPSAETKKARLEAERRRGRAIQYTYWRSLR